ncbi:MAG: hypothetical protein IKO41_17825 [Lachnospiraceae bacterium]|nr:hypothetical protein [Lachnospiraceae bacterium]
MRKLNKNEEAYAFSRNKEIDEASGCVGHLRGDFGSAGTQFFHSWWPHQNDVLNTPEFKEAFGNVMDSLKRGCLGSRRECAKFCWENLDQNFGEYHGFGGRVDEGDYAFIFRLNPKRGDYDIYVYCYVRSMLNEALKVGIQ